MITGRRGPGASLPGELAVAARQSPATVRIYGRDHDASLADITCLWRGCLDTGPLGQPGVEPAHGHVGVA